jgi:pimeloyl-ACP methyl ester carboxylesterase
MFVAGEHDLVLKMMAEAVTAQPVNMPNLKATHIVPGAGHWVQQQQPDAVNEMLIGFLRGI